MARAGARERARKNLPHFGSPPMMPTVSRPRIVSTSQCWCRGRRSSSVGVRVGQRGREAPGETRAAAPGRPDIAMIRDNETMMLVMAVFVGRAVRGATPRHYRPAVGSGRRGLRRPVARWGSPVVTVR